jgi:hypothetical protein
MTVLHVEGVSACRLRQDPSAVGHDPGRGPSGDRHRNLEIADRGYVLENGRVVLSGPAGELADDETIGRSYLGR